MNINYKETQIDFLSHVSGKTEAPVSPRYMAARLSLSLENLVIFSIMAIMVVIFSFAMGIERGKVMTGVSSQVPGAVAVKEAEPLKADHEDVQADGHKQKHAAEPSQTVARARPMDESRSAGAETAGAYTLQVASYKNLGPAQREAEKLRQKGFQNVYVLPKGAYTIVCVGNFRQKEDASDIRRQLKSRYQGSVVRRL